MSIIYDALKKVETQVDKPNGNPLQFKKHKAARPKFYTYLIYLLVLCGGFFAAHLLFKFIFPEEELTAKKTTQPAIVAPLKISPQISPPQPDIAPKSLPETPPPSKDYLLLPPETQEHTTPLFVVSGIFFSENQGFAIINDRVVKEGDAVEGAKVERISADGVKLKYEGVVIELSPGSN